MVFGGGNTVCSFKKFSNVKEAELGSSKLEFRDFDTRKNLTVCLGVPYKSTDEKEDTCIHQRDGLYPAGEMQISFWVSSLSHRISEIPSMSN